jgi:2-C-methyl-D-erythritol 4-phosphate cytidylyltransferase
MHQSGLSPAYKRASDVYRKATDDFSAVQRLYTQNSISSYELLAAQLTYKLDIARFDLAFHKELKRKKP